MLRLGIAASSSRGWKICFESRLSSFHERGLRPNLRLEMISLRNQLPVTHNFLDILELVGDVFQGRVVSSIENGFFRFLDVSVELTRIFKKKFFV